MIATAEIFVLFETSIVIVACTLAKRNNINIFVDYRAGYIGDWVLRTEVNIAAK